MENENLEIIEKISEINDGVNMVEFRRISGNIQKYYEIVMKLKENIEKNIVSC